MATILGTARIPFSPPASDWRARARRVAGVLFAALLLVLAFQAPPARAQGVLADKPDVQAALDRFTGGHNYASEAERARDQATLFANNDAINKARLNNEIPDSAYQAAQADYADLNRTFAEQAANDAGANFKVQKSSSPDSFSPGTDSDYITEVTSKEQIPKMQQGYNDQVNRFLEQNGVSEQRNNWHNKLDTDFMADPEFITDPDEFRDIAKYNNDAYKRRMAAEYERISRAGDGTRIGPEHVEGYMDEMNDFIHKKRGKIDEMLAKGPSHFSDPANRAELFQAMAQEQKYTSRLESLDDYLRAQEGLPPRNRGLTASKLGANRAPGNASNIRAGRAVGEASRVSAMEDLAETMGQVAKKNPNFNPNMADDIAKIVEGLPPDRRAGVLARIKGNGNPGLVDDILDASRRAGRLPPGATLADDVARAGSKFDDIARAAGKVDDLAQAGTGRGALGKAVGALEAIGKAADTLEGALAAGQLADLFRQLHQASDPELSPEERNELLEKIREAANRLRDSAALGAIMQRYPPIAAIYGVWTVGCLAGEFRSASTEASGGCLDRHMSAWDRAVEDIQSWWTGNPTARDAHAQALCDKFIAAVKEKRVRMHPDWTVREACSFIRSGLPISHMVLPPEEEGGKDEEKAAEPEIVLTPASCDPSVNTGTIAGLREAASSGRGEAIAHIARLEAVNGQIGSVRAAIDTARQSYAAGNMDAVRSGLNGARATLDGMGGEPECSDLTSQIASGLDKADRLERVLGAARDAVDSCSVDALQGAKSTFGDIDHPSLRALMARADIMIQANAHYLDAKSSYERGELAATRAALNRAQTSLGAAGEGACADLRRRVSNGLARVDRLGNAIEAAERAVATCDPAGFERWTAAFAKVSNPAAAPVKGKLAAGVEACRERQREEDVVNANARCAESFGPLSVASQESVASDNLQCTCSKGNIWNDDKTKCVKGPTEEEIAAANNADCKSRFGSGYYAGKANSKGVYYCLPTRSAANGICRQKYGGNYVAGKIKSNGAFNCNLSGSAQRQAALDNCRRKYGSRFIRLVRRNGQYLCEYNTGQPRHDPNTSAAQVIQGVIGVINNSRNSGGGGGGARPSNCHHRPGTSQQHCGSESSAPRITPQSRNTEQWQSGRQPPPQCRTHRTNRSDYWQNMTDPRCR